MTITGAASIIFIAALGTVFWASLLKFFGQNLGKKRHIPVDKYLILMGFAMFAFNILIVLIVHSLWI